MGTPPLLMTEDRKPSEVSRGDVCLEKPSIPLSSQCDYILRQAAITRVHLSQGEPLIVPHH